MFTPELLILKLRTVKVLTDAGLDLGVLEDGVHFGKDQDAITSYAVVWELARRYNQSYRSDPDHDFVFESEDAWITEAKWFAQSIMREWSGHSLPWLGRIESSRPSEAPTRAEGNDEHKGRLPWMDEEHAYNIYLMVDYRIEDYYLDDDANLDPLIIERQLIIQSPRNLELFKYQPFRSPPRGIVIGPTNVEARNQYATNTEILDREFVTYIPGSAKPYPIHYVSWSKAADQKLAQGQQFRWWSYLNDSRQDPLDSQAIAAGLDPAALLTHNTVDKARMKFLQTVFDIPDRLQRRAEIRAYSTGEPSTEQDNFNSNFAPSSAGKPGATTPPNVVHHLSADRSSSSSTATTPSRSSKSQKSGTAHSTPPSSREGLPSSPASPSQVPSRPLESNSPPSVVHHLSANKSSPSSTATTPSRSSKSQKLGTAHSTPPSSHGTTSSNRSQSTSQSHNGNTLSPTGEISPIPSHTQIIEKSARGLPTGPSQIPLQTPSQPPSPPREGQASSPTGLTAFISPLPSQDGTSDRGSLPSSIESSQTPSQPPPQPHSPIGVTAFIPPLPSKDGTSDRASLPSSIESSQTPSQPPPQPHSPIGVTAFIPPLPSKDGMSDRASPPPSNGPSQTPTHRHLLRKSSGRLLPQVGVGSYLKKKIRGIERRLSKLSIKSAWEGSGTVKADEYKRGPEL